MRTKPYKIPETYPDVVSEPAVAYHVMRSLSEVETRSLSEVSTRSLSEVEMPSNSWGPNAMFNGTQEEFMEHIHRIEEGDFMTIEEADKEFETWKTKFLASRM